MSEQEIGLLVLTISIFLAFVHILGFIFERLKQPRLVGEILAGVILGPFVLDHYLPSVSALVFGQTTGIETTVQLILSFMYWMGLLFLMFISGSQTRRLLSKENRRETVWLLGVGTPLPFIIVMVLGLTGLIPLDPLVGVAKERTSALLILAIATSVTSIPVISRIFHDLKILNTRFASLILGSAVLEDLILWGVLAVAAALARPTELTQKTLATTMSEHIFFTLAYITVAIFVAPKLLSVLRKSRWNLLFRTSPIAYAVVVLLSYAAIAAALEVNIVFAAFLAGVGLAGGVDGSEREHFAEAFDSISKFTFAVFTPIYFALVGYRLVLGNGFSLPMLFGFLIGSSVIALISVGLAAKLAGFKKLEIINLAITTNARGGPGIVLASVAYQAGIISAAFYTTLVLTAVITSQAAGAWLRYVLSKGWPLLYPIEQPKNVKKSRKRRIKK